MVDQYAALYDEIFVARQLQKYTHHDRNFWQVKLRSIAQMTGPLVGQRLLDLGCGVGTCAIEYGLRGNQTVGVDYTLGAARAGQEISQSKGLTQTTFCVGNVAQLPFESGTFDGVLASDIFEHLVPEVLDATIGECARILKPGGTLYVMTWPTRYRYIFNSRVFLACVLPGFWLPPQWLKAYIRCIDRTIVQWYHVLRHGMTHDAYRLASIHPNPLTVEALRALFVKRGFASIRISLQDLYGQEGRLRAQIVRRLFRSCDYAQSGLYAVCTTPTDGRRPASAPSPDTVRTYA